MESWEFDMATDGKMGGRDPRRLEQLRTMALLGAAAIILIGPLTGAGAIHDLRATSDGQDVVLCYCRGRPSRKRPTFYLRRMRKGVEWAKEREKVGRVLALAGGEGRIAIMLRGAYRIYEGDESSAAGKWPLPWEPCAAALGGETLWAVGVKDNRLVAARRKGEERWQEVTGAPKEDVVPNSARAVAIDAERVLVVWLARPRSLAVGAAVLRPSGWGPSKQIYVGVSVRELAAARHETQPWILYICRPKPRRAETRYLKLNVTVGDQVVVAGPAGAVPLRPGANLAACVNNDTAFVFCLRHRRVRYTRLAEQGWQPPGLLPKRPGAAETFTWVTSAAAVIAALVISKVTTGSAQDRADVRAPDGRTFAFAPLWSRGLAFIADGLLCAVASVFLAMPFLGQATFATPESVFPIATAVNFPVRVVYYTLCEAARGQTLGKYLCGLVVVRDDGRSIGFRQALIRNLLRIIDEPLMIGLIVVITSLRYQRAGDLVAHTVVVQQLRNHE